MNSPHEGLSESGQMQHIMMGALAFPLLIHCLTSDMRSSGLLLVCRFIWMFSAVQGVVVNAQEPTVTLRQGTLKGVSVS